MSGQNLFANVPADRPDEIVSVLVEGPAVRVVRIVSRGHASPSGFWYDQDEHEWVLVVSGSATLRFEDDRSVELGPGDWMNIPARVRHRVDRTATDEDTVWVAVFYATARAGSAASSTRSDEPAT